MGNHLSYNNFGVYILAHHEDEVKKPYDGYALMAEELSLIFLIPVSSFLICHLQFRRIKHQNARIFARLKWQFRLYVFSAKVEESFCILHD